MLEYLEEVEVNTDTDTNSRFQVQYVIRPQNMKYFADSYENNEQGERQFDELHDYRGYAGKILSGDFRKGDRIQILPTEISTKIDRIEINGSEVEEAFEGQSVVLHIEDDIDVSRGDFFVSAEQLPHVEKEVEVLLCWFDQKALQPGNKYILQHHSRLIKALVKDVEYKVNVNTLEHEKADGDIKLNEIVKVTLKTAQPLVFDSFRKNKATGSAILVDETSNSTVAACIIQ